MSGEGRPAQFFIGWDVGGWNCDNNRASRDALVILDAERNLVGMPWRGNLRTHINEAATARDWIGALFSLCAATKPDDTVCVTLAIDTPLGFSEAFVRLVTGLGCTGPVEHSETNPYLFRQTEYFLFQQGLKPLSAIKDMIGSQATKGMHVLAKFTPRVARCGVWTDGPMLTAIEAYPSACKASPLVQDLLARYVVAERNNPPERLWIEPIDNQDKLDALTCALVAHTFTYRPETLACPPDSIPETEGWIWIPNDALRPDARRRIFLV